MSMNGKNNKNKPKKKPEIKFFRGGLFWILIFLGIIWLITLFSPSMGGLVKKLSYNEFYSLLEANRTQVVSTSMYRQRMSSYLIF